MEKDIKQFMERDNINPLKFLANLEIMKNVTKEIYQAGASLSSQEDINGNATKTIHWMAFPTNQPLGYPAWFMTAYPDVAKWASNLEEEKLLAIVGRLTEDDTEESGYFRLPILRKIVDAYKIISSLECC